MTRPHISTAQRRRRMALRHRLVPQRRVDDPVAIADDLVALHSSDPTSVYLSAMVRMKRPATGPIERALYDDRRLIRHHAMRRTIWVASLERTRQHHASSTRKIAAGERRKLLQYLEATDGVDDPARTLDQLSAETMAAVAELGPVTARRLGQQVPALARRIVVGSAGHNAEVGAHTRLLQQLGFEGRLVRGRPRGTWVASEYAWSRMDDWVDLDVDGLEERPAMAGLLAAWLDRFGPGTMTDLRWWTGWTAAAVKRALADIEAVEVDLDGGSTGWVLGSDPWLDGGSDEVGSWVALLPGLDPTTMGWKDRDWYLDEHVAAQVFDRNGNGGPTIWVDGRIVGGWVQRPDGSIATAVDDRVSAATSRQIDERIDSLVAAIGDIRFRVRFPAPNQKPLLAS